MNTIQKKNITIEAFVQAPIRVVWKLWNTPEDIVRWNAASDDWHTPRAATDFKPGGKFQFRMEAKDGSAGFDFEGVYNAIQPRECIAYTLGDGRIVKINFTSTDTGTKIEETFEAENQNSIELQRAGWQSILNNFKKYAEDRL
jgi:uncharacterized protein YndB with AHSA1/START domain